MTNDQAVDVASEIERIVEVEAEVQGSKLAALVRQKFPEWIFPTTLRRFLEERVPSVVPIRRSGMDYVYGRLRPGEAKPVVESIQATTRPHPWRAWVSPNGRLDLVVSPATAAVEVVPRGSPTPPDSIRLTPPSSLGHKEMAGAFLQKQSEALRVELSRLLEDKSDWWVHWVPVLQRVGQLDEWRNFRRSALVLLLRDALKELNAEAVDRVLTNVVGSGKPATHPKNPTSVESLRAFVVRVVQHMDERELRALQLPAGAVHASQKSTT